MLGCQQLSAGYDAEAGGGLFATDEPIVAGYLNGREPGVALDAACGTGRFAEFLAARGHRVIGVDSSPDMLAYARRRVPGERWIATTYRRWSSGTSSDPLLNPEACQPPVGGSRRRQPGS